MPEYRKNTFIGGINQWFDPTKINTAEDYYIVINGRNRKNTIAPVKLPLDITSGLPASGLVQGLYGADKYLIIFIAGLAYVKDYAAGGNWNVIPGFLMSSTEPTIWTALVPASTVNYTRVSADGKPEGDVTQELNIGGSLQCMVCMNGVDQPRLIFPDGTAREAQNFNQWTPLNREYVPIAKYPLWYNGNLYCVGKNNAKFDNQIYRSVTGRPLDFMVAVNGNGDKITNNELTAGAPQVAHRVDYDHITCMSAINVINNGFLVTTRKASHLVFPNYTRTIFGEPTFDNQFLFSVGALNQFSVADTLGDAAIISYKGIRSFNGTLQIRNEGRNTPFSARISMLLDGITQSSDAAAAITFDNYVAMAVQTKHGPGILWYDTLIEKWAALDLYPGVGDIKQFCTVVTDSVNKLFFVTTDNKVYEAFGSDSTATAQIYLNEYAPQGGASSEHCIQSVRTVFSNIQSGGYVSCSVVHDKRRSTVQTKELEWTSNPSALYEPVPFNTQIETESDTDMPVIFDFRKDVQFAWRAGAFISWSANAELCEIFIETEERMSEAPRAAASRVSGSLIDPDTLIMVGNTGSYEAVTTQLVSTMLKLNPTAYVLCGDELGDHGDITDLLITPFGKLVDRQKVFTTLGNFEIDDSNGMNVLQYMNLPRWYKKSFNWVDIFVINSVAEAAYDEQLTWLTTELAASTKPHKIVVLHYAPYSSYKGMATPAWRLPFKTMGATAVISAHPYFYERLAVGGIPYINVGTGGYVLTGWDKTPLKIGTTIASEARIKKAGYLEVKAYPLDIEYRFKDVNNVTLDQWLIKT